MTAQVQRVAVLYPLGNDVDSVYRLIKTPQRLTTPKGFRQPDHSRCQGILYQRVSTNSILMFQSNVLIVKPDIKRAGTPPAQLRNVL